VVGTPVNMKSELVLITSNAIGGQAAAAVVRLL
jgi:hypothetical protein